ncbi:GtrA family protein [Paenibacillus sp. JX-17]|uniref:GtrA family protein n=2 Tax=Paenibacillus lacisoli TaxID=3064525 RepID=A0ABT9CFV1_9BACL|nr:GtrA family protein [Paenibacillus sp. JX-17]
MIGKISGFIRSSDLVRFILVGVVNTLIGLTVTFLCLNALHLNYWASTLIGNVVGAVNSYFMNKAFTFRSEASLGETWWRFILVTAACYVLAYGLASYAVQAALHAVLPDASLRLRDNMAALIGSGMYTLMNYAGQKLFTFRRTKEKLEG